MGTGFIRAAKSAAAAFILGAALVSCDREENAIEPVSGPVPEDWTPERTSVDLLVGESVVIGGDLVYSDGSTCHVTAECTGGAPEVVTVQGGRITAVGPGSATVQATVKVFDGDDISNPAAVFTRSVSVNVIADEGTMTGLELSPAAVTISRGESFIYKVTVIYGGGGRRDIEPALCSWSAVDDGTQHLTYTAGGEVTGRQGTGDTVITATYTYGETTVSASSTVTVTD